MSESVERRLLARLGNPTVSPYGNPIPGLDELIPELASSTGAQPDAMRIVPVASLAADEARWVTVRRIAEPLQNDAGTMTQLRRTGIHPGASVQVQRTDAGVRIASGGEVVELGADDAAHVLVEMS